MYYLPEVFKKAYIIGCCFNTQYFTFRDGKNAFSAIQVSWKVGDQNEKKEVEGLIEAIIQLNLTEGTIITFDQEDTLVKDGKTIRLVPG